MAALVIRKALSTCAAWKASGADSGRADHRREEQGVELVRGRNRRAVDRRQRRMGLRDRQRQLDCIRSSAVIRTSRGSGR